MAKGGKVKKPLGEGEEKEKKKTTKKSSRRTDEVSYAGDEGAEGDGIGDNLLGLDDPIDYGGSNTMQHARDLPPNPTEDAPIAGTDDWYTAKAWGSPGPPTARGAGGGGWDAASDIGGGSRSSTHTNTRHQRETSSTFKKAVTEQQITSTPGGARVTTTKKQLTTVEETRDNAPNESARSSAAVTADGRMSFPEPQTQTSRTMMYSTNTPRSPPGRDFLQSQTPVQSMNPTLILSSLNGNQSPPPNFPMPMSMSMPSPMPHTTPLPDVPRKGGKKTGKRRQLVDNPLPPRTHEMPTISVIPATQSPRASSFLTNSHPSFHPSSPTPNPNLRPTPEIKDAQAAKSVAFMQVSYSGGGAQSSVVGITGDAGGNPKVQVFVPGGTRSMDLERRSGSTEGMARRSGSTEGGGRTTSTTSHMIVEEDENGEERRQDKGKGRAVTLEDEGGVDEEGMPRLSTSGGANGLIGQGGAWYSWPSKAGPSRPLSVPIPSSSLPPNSAGLVPPSAAPTQHSFSYLRALNETSRNPGPPPTHDARIQDTGKLAIRPAERAMFGRHRHATERFFWTLPSRHDDRVSSLLDWVSDMTWSLGALGLEKFLAFRQRGALFANADFRPWKTPDEPGFDWMTFQEVQNTFDLTIQESIAKYDPGRYAVVFVFLVSKTGSSLGIWRRMVHVPPSHQARYDPQIQQVKRELAAKGSLVTKIEPPLVVRPALVPAPNVRRKKRKWWQFWKSDEPPRANIVTLKENVEPSRGAGGRSKLAKRR